MRPNNISFAAVLKSKGRSPPPPAHTPGPSLAQLLAQWEDFPDADYTLHLGNFTRSFRTQHSAARPFASRQGQEEEMFDSWIQRQSALNANKENVSAQRRVPPDSGKPSSGKLTFGSRPREV
jgi:hypothetical protein